jgi:hypothetical protein
MEVSGDARGPWPNSSSISGASFSRVDTSVSCVLTRFRLRSWRSLLLFYVFFWRIRRASHEVEGLLKTAFLVENLHTCYTLSFWRDDWAMIDFGTRVHSHVEAARSAFGATFDERSNKSEIWSAQFRLWAVSRHNLRWQGLNLEDLFLKESGNCQATHIPNEGFNRC